MKISRPGEDKMTAHIFIAGVMQGARLDNQIHAQDYRTRITTALRTHVPGVHITDPWELNPDSVNYDEQRARHTFLSMTRLAGEADLLIAYLPTISMGTAMEMWQAHQAHTYIIVVTPFVHHWAVRFTADEILPDLDSLLAAIADGRIQRLLAARSQVDAPALAD
jgi:hypothetical protein